MKKFIKRINAWCIRNTILYTLIVSLVFPIHIIVRIIMTIHVKVKYPDEYEQMNRDYCDTFYVDYDGTLDFLADEG